MAYSKFWGFTRTQDGAQPISGVNVDVYLAGTTTAASIYADENGSTALTNLQSDTDGYFEFYAAPGDYDLIFTKTGYTFRNLYDVTIGAVGAAASGEGERSSRVMWTVPVGDVTDSNISEMSTVWGVNTVMLSDTASTANDSINSALSILDKYGVTALVDHSKASIYMGNDSVSGFYTTQSDLSTALGNVQGDKPLVVILDSDLSVPEPSSTPLCPVVFYLDVFDEAYSPDYSSPAFGEKFTEADPPSANMLRAAIYHNALAVSWSGPGVFAGLDLSGYSSGGSYNTNYIPSASTLVRSLRALGPDWRKGVVVGDWNRTNGNKVGLSVLDASDSKLTAIRREIITPLISEAYVSSVRTMTPDSGELGESWHGSILLNPYLFTPLSSALPYLWGTDGTASDLSIAQNFDTNSPLIQVANSGGSTITLYQRRNLPGHMRQFFDGKMVYFSVIGYGDGSIQIALRDPDTGTVKEGALAAFPDSGPTKLVVAGMPYDNSYSEIEVRLNISATSDVYLNSLYLGLGVPDSKMGFEQFSSMVRVNGVSRAVGQNIWGYSQIPLFVNTGQMPVTVPASGSTTVTISFPAGPGTEPTFIPAGADPAFRVVSVHATARPVWGTGTSMNTITYYIQDYDINGHSVSVYLANSSGLNASVIVDVTMFLLPISYGAAV